MINVKVYDTSVKFGNTLYPKGAFQVAAFDDDTVTVYAANRQEGANSTPAVLGGMERIPCADFTFTYFDTAAGTDVQISLDNSAAFEEYAQRFFF